MYKFATYLVLFVFSIYWSITVVFISPSNYINISLLEYSYIFETFFYQKWAFFSPPPSSNDRLYYVFQNKITKKERVFEVIEPITKLKSIKAPFNTEEDILDYVLSNTVNTIRDEIVSINEVIKYRQTTKKIILTSDEKIKLYNKRLEGGSSLQTLKNYSKLVAQKNNIEIESSTIKILIGSIEIPKFHYRNSDKIKNSGTILYESEKFEL
ncbi:hypothetical protein [Flavobacterium sp.]|jgi:hypothetical protein|uniref:hypothetical protein n=1 Tax=Flavobacterium sp. TaxID=239 RepID=UPI0037BED088